MEDLLTWNDLPAIHSTHLTMKPTNHVYSVNIPAGSVDYWKADYWKYTFSTTKIKSTISFYVSYSDSKH